MKLAQFLVKSRYPYFRLCDAVIFRGMAALHPVSRSGLDNLALHPFTAVFVLLVHRPRANLRDCNCMTFAGHGKVSASMRTAHSRCATCAWAVLITITATRTLAARHSAKAPTARRLAGADAKPYAATEPPQNPLYPNP